MFVLRLIGWAAAAWPICLRLLAGAFVGSQSSIHRWDIVAFALVLALGIYFSFGPGSLLVAKAKGGIISLNSQRSLSFHSYMYWAPILAGFAFCCLIVK
jgi:hypothetical protein